ncbi:MAG: coenzyme F420-0:L-glutamate ligase [Nitrososphaeraceae archaeon]|nr:coenzyme F420-0:L-glutamate ligase [Nitrososphaeraceae archaeon]
MEILPVKIAHNIQSGERIQETIINAIFKENFGIENGDVLVIAQKIISKSEGRLVSLDTITPSEKSIQIGNVTKKDPRLIEIILNESKKIIRMSERILIVETKHGFICANAGIDKSNVDDNEKKVLLLPKNPDRSANKIRLEIKKKTKKDVAVIISDTFGRPFRIGQVNVAIGISGINPIKSYIGTKDIFGKNLYVTEIAVADELCSAAELVMEKIAMVPVVIIRGYKYKKGNNKIHEIIRDSKRDLFRR